MKLIDLMPYIVAILTSIISGFSSYLLSKRDFINEVEKIKINNKHEIDKLVKQQKVDIENLKEQHKMEVEIKDMEHKHEKEILELQSKNTINEHGQEAFNVEMAKAAGGILNDIISGKLKPEELKKLSDKLKTVKINNENN